MAEFYIFAQDTQAAGGPIIAEYPADVEITDLTSGRRVHRGNEPIMLTLSPESDDFRPDLVTYLLPLFSDRVKTALRRLNVDNIDYYPVVFQLPHAHRTEEGYWLANIIGTLESINMSQSKPDLVDDDTGTPYSFTSIVIDEAKVGDRRIFRPAEQQSLIVINERLRDELIKLDLQGVKIVNTREYEGF